MAKGKGKKRTRRVLIFLSILVFAAIGITIAYAANNLGNTATNVVTVGHVQIALHNEDDEEVNRYNKGSDFVNRNIIPGEQIEKIVSVENIGDYPAYIRMKVKKEWLNNDNAPQFPVEAIEPTVEKGWSIGVAEDSDYVYYYYNTIVTPSAIIPFMNSFCVSAAAVVQDNIEKNPNAEGKITVVAEAVQSDYYMPTKDKNGNVIDWEDGVGFGEDFKNDTPNPSIATQAAVVNESSVEFVGNSGDFVSFKTGTDLFLNVKGLMPNQTVEQTIHIQNVYSSPVEVYLYAKVPDTYLAIARTNTEWELLKALELTITNSKNNKIIYTGSLFEENSSKDMLSEGKAICLGNFQPGEECQLSLSVTLPKTWSHSYCQTMVDWVFLTKTPIPTQAPTRTSPPSVVKPTPTPIPTVMEVEQTVPPADIPIDAAPPTEPPTPEPTEPPTPEPTKPPTPEPTKPPTPEPTEIPAPTVLPTPDDWELDGDENPLATANVDIVPDKTEKPQKPKKTKKPAASPTKNPEEEIDGNIPRIDVAPELPKESATKTGDDTPIFFWVTVCFVSLMGVLYNGIILGKRKDKREE